MNAVAEVRDAWRLFRLRNARLLASAIAFSTLLSVVPILLIALRIAAGLTDEGSARALLVRQVGHWLGATEAPVLLDILGRARESSESKFTTVLSIVTILYGATRLWSQLRSAFAILWETELPKAGGPLQRLEAQLYKRAVGLVLVLVTGLTLAGLVMVHAGLERSKIVALVPGAAPVVEWMASLGVTMGLFACIFALLPPERVPWRAALYGGVVTGFLVTIGSVLVGAYVAHKGTLTAFGAGSSLVMLLLWVHYAAHVFFFGAALTRVRMLAAR